METHSIIQRIEITREKIIFVVVLKQAEVNGNMLGNEVLRIPLAPLADIESQMANENALLVAKGFPAISDDEIASVRKQANAAWEGYVVSQEEE